MNEDYLTTFTEEDEDRITTTLVYNDGETEEVRRAVTAKLAFNDDGEHGHQRDVDRELENLKESIND